jgi:glutathione synthase/RimK-type ligase-like ATP-grasp enzyme
VNHPHLNAAAGVKPHALAIAAQSGLRVPETLITNDPAAAREFVAALPGGVAAYKTIGAVGPVGTGDEAVAVWTTRVHADEITDAVALTAHQFQEWIPKDYEVRVTVVGRHMFAAEIHTPTPLDDVRTDYDSHTYKQCTVPASVAAGVRRLLDEFGLSYAAMDFLVDPRGTWTLCDLNPSGQWAYIPDLRTPITHALADLLEIPA